MSCVVASLYKFVRLVDYRELRDPLLRLCLDRELLGTLLLAEEGINGTVAGSRAAVDALLQWLRADARLADIRPRETRHAQPPFARMKVRLKREIVTMGVAGVSPAQRAGRYVAPADWNALIDDPGVTVIDTRNDYECAIGSFRGALDPQLDSFREFPAWARENLDPAANSPVAMFCTGGIRCEKASAWLLGQGFAEVFHLRGGILAYLDEVPASDSRWHGECFVFDERVAVREGLAPGSHVMCHGCGRPVSPEQRRSPLFSEGISCHRCHGDLDARRLACLRERRRQPARSRGAA